MDLKQSNAGINHKYWGFMLIYVAKTQHFPLTLEDFSENSSILPKTQGFFSKTQGFSSKNQDFGNSRNFRCRKKRQKKACRKETKYKLCSILKGAVVMSKLAVSECLRLSKDVG